MGEEGDMGSGGSNGEKVRTILGYRMQCFTHFYKLGNNGSKRY